MSSSVVQLNARLDALQKVDGEHAKQVAELNRALEDARGLLAVSAMDTAAREAKTEADIAAVQTRLDHLGEVIARGSRERAEAGVRFERRLAVLEQSDQQLADKIALFLPDDKDQLWRQATSLLAAGQREQGRRYCEVFIERFPQDPRASQAYLSIGQSYADEGRFPNAAAALQRLLSSYPASPEVPEAMWQLSRAFEQMAFCADARALLRSLVDHYPKSRPASDATKELTTLKHSSSACVS